MSMTSWVVLGLSLATVLLLLGAFVATMRQDRRGRPPAPPAEVAQGGDPLPAPVFMPAPSVADYDDPREIRVRDDIQVHGTRKHVRGALHISLQGKTWTEYVLTDATRRPQSLTVAP
jgi:hypothetical protein